VRRILDRSAENTKTSAPKNEVEYFFVVKNITVREDNQTIKRARICKTIFIDRNGAQYIASFASNEFLRSG
jgi:hypothetical protein